MDAKPSSLKIRQYITRHVSEYPSNIAWIVGQTFGISRQAVNRHLRVLESEGVIESEGRGKGTKYRLAKVAELKVFLPLRGLQEDVPWSQKIRPLLEGVKPNVLGICEYGFTEMLNNAIDHSGSEQVAIAMERTVESIHLTVSDSGIGIFRKIREACGLRDDLESALELAKGKLTTDPTRHSGEGIFFTSRAFDRFVVLSGELYFSHVRQGDDWLLQDHQTPHEGTFVKMEISARSTETVQATFDRFSEESGVFDFSKTHVPVSFMQVGNENLVSRSQAKRLLTRFSRFREVMLDFKGVERIGQAFADEVFRVFASANPAIEIVAVNTSPEIREMINRAKVGSQSE